MNIQSIGTTSTLNNISLDSINVDKSSNTAFSEVLSNAIGKVNELELNANNNIESLIKGEDISMHEVMLSMQESQLSLQALIEVRNKVVEAYQEISKLQL